MIRGLLRPVFFFALGMSLLSLGAVSALAEPGVYQPERHYTSPLGDVRWFKVRGTQLLVSDLKRGVAAISLSDGRIQWSKMASGGRLDRLWLRDTRLVMAGVNLEVVDPIDGQTFWTRNLACPTGGVCANRVMAVDKDSIILAGGGAVHTRLSRIAILSGKSLWKASAPIKHPRKLIIAGDFILTEDAIPPFTLRRLTLSQGKNLVELSAPFAGTGPSDALYLSRAGWVTALRRNPTDGTLAKVARMGPGPSVVMRIHAGDKLPTRAVWAHVSGNRMMALIPHPTQSQVFLVSSQLKDGARVRQLLTGSTLLIPKTANRHLVTVAHTDSTTRFAGFEPSGFSSPWQDIRTLPLQPGAIFTQGHHVLVVFKDGPSSPFVLLDGRNGQWKAVGRVLDASVNGVAVSGNRLFLAQGKGVRSYRLGTLSQAAKGLRDQVLDGETATAFQTYGAMSLLIHHSDEVVTLLRVLVAQKFIDLRHQMQKGNAVGALHAIRDILEDNRMLDPEQFRLYLRPAASLLSDEILSTRKRSPISQVGALLSLARPLRRLIRYHGKRFSSPSYRDAFTSFRSLVFSLAAVLAKSGKWGTSADLFKDWLDVTQDEIHGVKALYRVVSLAGLAHRFALVKEDLTSSDDARRKRAGQLLADYRHGPVCFLGARIISTLNGEIASQDPSISRTAATRLVELLKKAIKRAWKDTGKPLSRPGCTAVCLAVETTCLNRCREPKACTKAGKRCVRSCKRGRLPRWRPPSGIPGPEDDVRFCD